MLPLSFFSTYIYIYISYILTRSYNIVVAKAFTARKISGRSAGGSARGGTPDRRPPVSPETPDPDPRCRDGPATARTSNDNYGITVSFRRTPPAIQTTWRQVRIKHVVLTNAKL